LIESRQKNALETGRFRRIEPLFCRAGPSVAASRSIWSRKGRLQPHHDLLCARWSVAFHAVKNNRIAFVGNAPLARGQLSLREFGL
jgi:hypothetical protein